MKTQRTVKNYEIRVDGFDVENTTEGETILRGPIIDQAALHGILARIYDLGLSLTLFRQIGEEQ
jgi:hypothetical protein